MRFREKRMTVAIGQTNKFQQICELISIFLFIILYFCLFSYLFVCLSSYLPFHLPISLSDYLPVYLSRSLSVCQLSYLAILCTCAAVFFAEIPAGPRALPKKK